MNKNNYYRNLNCWISGGGSGIGSAVALKLAALGANVIISGRNSEKLDIVASQHDSIFALPLDVSIKEQWQAAVKIVGSKFNHLDVIILNAGVCQYIDLPEFDSSKFKNVMDVNFMGIVYGIEASLPLLRKSKNALIASVSSSVAPLPLPRAEAYGSSKAAATYLMNSLRLGLKEENIDVSVIMPGFVSTPLTDVNDFPMPFKISSEKAAEKIIKGLSSRKKEIYFPGPFTWPLRFLAILPMALQQIFTKRFVK